MHVPLMASASFILFATQNRYSVTILRALVANAINVECVILPGIPPPSKISSKIVVEPCGLSSPQPDILALCSQFDIPVFYVQNFDCQPIQNQLRAIQADILLVLCFPYKLPDSILKIASLVCLNLHPSMLPKYRGPNPIFWQLYYATSNMGVSLHELTGNIDAGNILAQQTIQLKPGLSSDAIDEVFGLAASELIVRYNSADTLISLLEHSAAQSVENMSYFSAPTPSSFVLFQYWKTLQAFNFIRGTQQWGKIYTMEIQGEVIKILSAISYTIGSPVKNLEVNGNTAEIRFSDGVLKVVTDSSAASVTGKA